VLSSVKTILFTEISSGIYYCKENTRYINRQLLSSIGHHALESVRIEAYYKGTILSGNEIQPLLNNSPNLKKFTYHGDLYEFFEKRVVLSFENQLQLSKAKFVRWVYTPETITSLKNCKKLEQLIIRSEGISYKDKIKAILINDHPWDLKRLELEHIAPDNDQELYDLTRRVPGLEMLDMKLNGISEDGMEIIGNNCPKLKALRFRDAGLTNPGLEKLTRQLPDLEVISIKGACKITEEGIAAIAKNCKKLRFLEIVGHKMNKSDIDVAINALIENCPDLKVVNFDFSLVCFDMYRRAVNRPDLGKVNVDAEQKEFYKKITFYSQVSHLLSVKKLHKLVS
jgi:hypothetical protein